MQSSQTHANKRETFTIICIFSIEIIIYPELYISYGLWNLKKNVHMSLLHDVGHNQDYRGRNFWHSRTYSSL